MRVTSLDKLIKFLEILNVLANTEDFKILNAEISIFKLKWKIMRGLTSFSIM